MIKKLASCIGEYKIFVILTPFMVIGEVVMEIFIPMLMAMIIDQGILGNRGVGYTIRMGMLMIAMALLSLMFGALGGKFAAKAATGFAKNLRIKLFDKVQDFSYANVGKFSTASLVTRLTTDVTNMQNASMMILRMAFRAPVMLVGATIMATIMNIKLATVFYAAIPVLGFALYMIGSNAHPRFEKMLRRYDRMNGDVQENLVGIRVVKAFVREEHEIEKFKESADRVRQAQFFAEKLIILNMPIMQFCMYGCIVAILWFGGNMVIDGQFAIGQISSFISYVTQILMSLMMLSFVFITIIISRASVTRILEVLNEEVDIRDDDANPEAAVKNGDIEFRNVSFSYTKEQADPTLEKINLSIRSGETIGIIGGTGSAKTSLVQLIPRLYDVTGGEILVGGQNVKEYKLPVLRDAVSMVLQKNVLFSGTIIDNLRWGNEKATIKEIEEACQSAQAHEFILSFPDGYQTDLGQGGVNLSGGQKQRLCIARALLKNPKIIVLDDSTSAVDTATDSKIKQALKIRKSETTTIIIAQRISSVCDADRILVMDDGRVDAFATHEDLMQTNQIYQEVYQSQQKGEE